MSVKIRSLIPVIIIVFFISCNKENPTKDKTENPKTESQQEETDTDTTMTVEEAFSGALVQNIMGEEGDDDLQLYLEEQIYPIVSKSTKVTLDRISASLYLLSYDDNGIMKNLLIQKFYNPVNDEFIFEKRETQSNSLKQFVK
ncbi:MAG: hypothetical protein ABI462_05780 [Ignavibacteria bacterium]